ncbi:MAG: GGDEF domain-containing protein, partial [Planctomycetota bacterium]
ARRRFHQRVGGQIGPDAPHVDLSIGLASRRLDRAGDLDTLLDRADQRLYAAKRLGRGRTVVSDDASASGIWPSPSPASDATPAVDEW